MNDITLKAIELLLGMIENSNDMLGYWSNTTTIERDTVVELIKLGVRVFNREPLYDINGYPLQYFHFGDGDLSKELANYNMVEQFI